MKRIILNIWFIILPFFAFTQILFFAGTSTQDISGTFTGTNALNILEINNNSNGITILGDVDIDDELKLTNGIIKDNCLLL